MTVRIQVGDTFGRLIVLEESGKNKTGVRIWNCLCSCGNEKLVLQNSLVTGNTKSCGCLKKEQASKTRTTHGMHKTKMYKSWVNMKSRCDNNKDKGYKNYGGRGIGYDSTWESFEVFLEDMGERPTGLTLDRIDNDKGYSKENCHWVTQKEQSRNRRSNVIISYNGETKCIMEWAEELGINYTTLLGRINRLQWSVEKALTTPIRQKNVH